MRRQVLHKDLLRARSVLQGANGERSKHHAKVISFANGDGVALPSIASRAAGLSAIFFADPKRSIEKYQFNKEEVLAKDALDAYLSRRLGLPGKQSYVLETGIARLAQAFLGATFRHSCVCLAAPSHYHLLSGWCNHFHLPLYVVSDNDHCYRMTAAALLEQIEYFAAAGTPVRWLFLTNPTITGFVYAPTELASIGAVCAAHGIVVFEDLAFMGTEFPSQSLASIASHSPRELECVSVFTTSKAYSLASARLAFAWGLPEIIERMREFKLTFTTNIPGFCIRAGLHALANGDSGLVANCSEMSARACMIAILIDEFNIELMNRFGVRPLSIEHPPMAGHSILVSLNGLSEPLRRHGIADSIELVGHFIRASGIAFSPALTIGYEGFQMRANFGDVGSSSCLRGVLQSVGFSQGRSQIRKALRERFFCEVSRLLD